MPKSVMCIDDESDILETLVNFFENIATNHRRVVAREAYDKEDGDALLAKVRTTPNMFAVHDAIICDMRCGGVDNFAHLLAAEMKAAGIKTPVVVYSGEVGNYPADKNILDYVSKTQLSNLETAVEKAAKVAR